MPHRIARVACLTILLGYGSAAAAEITKSDPPAAGEGAKTAATKENAAKGEVAPKEPAKPQSAAVWLQHQLARPTEVQYLDTQLGDVLVDLELRHRIDIELDVAALTADGKGGETLVKKGIRQIPLEYALDHILYDHGLTWYARDGLLIFTTIKGARAQTETKVYSLAALANAKGEPDYDAIQTVVDRAVFRAAGSHVNRTLRTHAPTKSLVVAANPIEQREVARLIGELHEAVRYQGDRRVLPLPSEAEEKIDQVLANPGEFQYLDTQLGDVQNDIEIRYRIFVELDEEGIKDAGTGNARGHEALVNYSGRNAPFGPALDRMLDPLGLTWTRDSVSIIITSKLFEPSFLTRRIYRVGDLIDTADEYDDLAALVRDTVADGTWRTDNAPPFSPEGRQLPPGWGEIATFRPAQALVVTQTPRAHRAIEAMLDDLRAAKGEK
jgi:hypothetical protein